MTESIPMVVYSQGCKEGWNAAEDEESLGDDGKFLNLDCIFQNSLNCTLYIPVSGSTIKEPDLRQIHLVGGC